jgi:hypothetical protein
MKKKAAPVCAEHKIKKKWQETTFEYRESGILVRVPKVFAWVCPEDGEASFTAETTDELIDTVRELISTAKRAKKRRSALTEYMVAIGR